MINERYLIKKKLGQGRSSVFLCSDSEFPDKDQAIKILSPDAPLEEVQSFNNEFFILRKLNHPNIVKSNELGSIVKIDEEKQSISVGSKFLTMEFFRGAELIKYKKLKDEKVLLEVIKQLCSVLYYLHQSNYIYYDLKHENILINETHGKPEIKLIDLGFAQYIPDAEIKTVRGTAEYIAPELLRSEEHDHRVDLYSLGILLYRIVYDTFPFKAEKEIDIYKSHLEEEFDFPSTKYSDKLVSTIKKLLAKTPEERFTNTLEVLDALSIDIDEKLVKDWVPATSFSSRKDVLTIIDTYLADKQSSEVIVIKGLEGAGKSALLNELYARKNNVVSIRENKSASGAEFVRFILKRIIYSGFVYANLPKEDIERAEKLMSELSGNLIDELKSLLGKITQDCNFILLLDGFNFYDDFTLEVLKNIFPILQVNGIKIILSENTNAADKTDIINNFREINLTPFTEAQLNEFIERSYYPAFPSEELKKTILQYADLLPGNIIGFIRDLILLKIIQFEPDSVKIKSDKKADFLLKSSHEQIYKLRIDALTEIELKAANLISSMESSIDRKSLSVLMDIQLDETIELLTSLQNKNIIQQLTLNSDPVFTTESLKRFVYAAIPNKKEFHLGLVKVIQERLPRFNKIELSRQYELAENYYESFLIIKDEISNAEKISAFAYQEKLLNHLLEIPLADNYKAGIEFELCNVLHKLGDNKRALELIYKIEGSIVDKKQKLELTILKGKCQIGLGDYEEGKNRIQTALDRLNNEKEKQALLVDIANAELELNKYSEVTGLCEKIIANKDSSGADKGKCYNFLGIVEIYRDNNLDGALIHFESAEKIYEGSGLKLRVAQMEMNIGNIYNIKGDRKLAVEYWNKSLELNKSIGNLEQEARLLSNFGVLFFYKLNFQKSLEFYKRAYSIFLSLGNQSGQATTQNNIGDIYFLTCEYQKAITSLTESKQIFESIQNYNECLESFFLLCKTYYLLGDYIIYERLLNDFEKLTLIESVSEKHKMNLEFLKILLTRDENKLKENLNRLKEIREGYLKDEEKYNYFYSSSIIVKTLIQLNELWKALVELDSEELATICKGNSYFEAERLYMLGLLSASGNDSGLKPAIEYYLNAYEIIKDLDITELTWKVLFMLTVSYADRGNFTRAADYIVYAKSVLDYIRDKITDDRLRMVYFDQPERKMAIETINKLTEQI